MHIPTVIASIAVNKIIEDLTDRNGLQNEWESMDSDVQDEIRTTWERIVANAVDSVHSPAQGKKGG